MRQGVAVTIRFVRGVLVVFEGLLDKLRVMMLGLPRRQKRLLQVLTDVVLVWAALWLAFWFGWASKTWQTRSRTICGFFFLRLL